MKDTLAGASPVDQPVVPLAPERWAPRDASWLNRPQIGGLPPRWHLVGADEAPACGYRTLLSIDLHNGWDQPPSESMKCARCLAWLKRHNARVTGPQQAAQE
jgi:hypothetical protein